MFVLMLFLLLFCCQGSRGLELQTFDDLYACNGGDVILPWTINVTEGETLFVLEWLYQGTSDLMLGMWTHGQFAPMPSYSGRVSLHGNVGIRINNVTKADSGNYTVTITASDAHGVALKLNSTAALTVGDGLMTKDGRLHASKQPSPVLDASGTFRLVLTCGDFLFTDNPSFTIEWLTPEGDVVPSDEYKVGQFLLHVKNPVRGGLYRCQIPSSNASLACMGGDTIGSRVSVDPVLARLMLLEAEAERQQEENSRLEAEDNQQQQANAKLKEENARLQQQLTDLREEMKEGDKNTSSKIDQLAENPCLGLNVTILDDPWRAITDSSTGFRHCEKNPSEWYRFMLGGKNAVIPTRCIKPRACGTSLPGWIDLEGGQLPGPGEERRVKRCSSQYYSGRDNCCRSYGSLIVRNCGTHLVYKIYGSCSLGYCAQLQNP